MPSDVSSKISIGVFIEWGVGRGVNGSLCALPFVGESRVTSSATGALPTLSHN